jgi:hypothetical protein
MLAFSADEKQEPVAKVLEMKIMEVYHGSSLSNMDNIINFGFDTSKIGSGWGTTYGDGIYFSFDSNVAKAYADNSNVVLEVKIKYNPYLLQANYSPTNKKHQKQLEKLRNRVVQEGYTCFVSSNGEEVVLFDTKNIISIKMIRLH